MNAHRFRVIYGDTDMMGVVYYANYLRYFEAGRNEFLRAAGLEYRGLETAGITLPVAEAKAKYLAPARYDDELLLETWIEEVRHVSVRMAYRLLREVDDTVLATGETLHACVDRRGKLIRFPDELQAKLRALIANAKKAKG
ncbi:MAG: acyl-CoA thioesterase [Deltaproteobacteria bacterium]|nr:acyl-CoA thioesterase [Deltaproteobacteria bacterium]